jgi:hypothetical protein
MSPEERLDFINDLTTALNKNSVSTLTDEEQRWVRIAIQKEAQTIDFRKAVIQKTMSSLIWSALVGMGYIVLSWLNQHGFK